MVDIARRYQRERGEYAEPEKCLVCDELVDASLPHIFVRDDESTLGDNDAIVGLLHPECEQSYLEAAEQEGLVTLPPLEIVEDDTQPEAHPDDLDIPF